MAPKQRHAYDAGRAYERAWIAGWLRGIAKGSADQHPVDRADCIALVAQLIERAEWLEAAPSNGGDVNLKERHGR